MCFSASVSFITSAMIFSAGLYAVVKSMKSNRDYIPLSLIPILFSIQQVSEGIIWTTMATTHVTLLHVGSLLYMFFAFLLWPAYFPFCLYCIEPNVLRKRILFGLTILGFILGIIIYIPLLMHEVTVNVTLTHKSLAYSMAITVYSQLFYTISYAFIMLFSSFFCSIKEIKQFGVLLLISFLISTLWFMHAFSSTWCYFSSILSLYIVFIMFYLPKKGILN